MKLLGLKVCVLGLAFAAACGSKDDDDESTPANANEFNEDGFLSNGAGVLRIGLAAAGSSSGSGSLRLAEPTDPNEKY